MPSLGTPSGQSTPWNPRPAAPPGLRTFLPAVLIAACLLPGTRGLAVPPPDLLATAFGASSDEGNGLAVASDGSVYLTGQASISTFRDGVRYGELGGEEFVHGGQTDFMLVKFNADLEPVWSRTLGGTRFDYGTAVRVGPGGDVWVTATYQADFMAGEQVVDNVTEGRADGFVARYTPDGTLAWLTPVASAGDVNLDDLQVDGNGNAYVVARIYDQVTIGGTTVGDRFAASAVLFRVGSDGQVVWAVKIASSSEVGAISVALPGPDRVVVAGGLGGATRGIFLGEYDASGTRRWLEPFATGTTESVSDVEVDSAGNFHLCGRFRGASFDLGGGVSLANPSGFFTGYLLKLSPAREPLWIVPAGSRGSEMVLGADGSPFLTGYYDDKATDVAGEVQPLAGGLEAYLASIREDGSLAWIRTFSTPVNEICRSIEMAPDGALIFAGEGTGDTVGVSEFRGRVFLGRLPVSPVPPRPSLGFRRVEGALEVSWPTDSGGFALESASSPFGPFESGAPGAEPVEGQANTYRIPTAEAGRYYRLFQQLPP